MKREENKSDREREKLCINQLILEEGRKKEGKRLKNGGREKRETEY